MSKHSDRIAARRRRPAGETKTAARATDSEVGRLAKRLTEWREADEALDGAETRSERARENDRATRGG